MWCGAAAPPLYGPSLAATELWIVVRSFFLGSMGVAIVVGAGGPAHRCMGACSVGRLIADSGGGGAAGWFSQLSGRFAVVGLPQPLSCTGAVSRLVFILVDHSGVRGVSCGHGASSQVTVSLDIFRGIGEWRRGSSQNCSRGTRLCRCRGNRST